MKKLLYLINITFAMLLAACGGSSEKDLDSYDYTQISAEWKLTEWADMPAEIDVYIDFETNQTFTMYQQVESVRFVKYTGTYSVKDDIISGKYSDGKPWGSSYILSFKGKYMTFVSKTEVAEVNVYTKTTIPTEVKEQAETNIDSKTNDVKRPL